MSSQHFSIVGSGSRSLALRWIGPRFVNHGALLRVGVSLDKAFAEVLTSGSRRLKRADQLKC